MLNLFSIPLSAVIISFLIPFLLMYTGLLLESTGAFIIKLESFKMAFPFTLSVESVLLSIVEPEAAM